MMLTKVLSVSFISFVLVGCTGTWVHPTKSQDQFDIDYARCQAESLMIGTQPVTYSGNAVADAYQGFANTSFSAASAMNYRNLCIKASGWKYQSETQDNILIIDSNNKEIDIEFKKFDKSKNDLCTDFKYKSYFSKTDCSCHKITFFQKSDLSFAKKDQISIMEDLFESQDVITNELSLYLKEHGNEQWKALVLFNESNKKDLDSARVDLFNRKISWGQYNQRISNYCTTINNKQFELGLN